MKKFISIALILFSVALLIVNATDDNKGKKSTPLTASISGTIIDETTGETLVGVAVYIEGVDQSVYTDFEGNFELKGLTPGEYTVKTNLISYKECSSQIKVDLEKENKIDLKLKSLSK